MKKKILLLIIISAIFLSLSNCQTTVITIDNGAPSPQEIGKPTEKKKYHTFGWGIYDFSKEYKSPCQNPNHVVIKRDYFIDIPVFIFINAIYSPRTIEVYCK